MAENGVKHSLTLILMVQILYYYIFILSWHIRFTQKFNNSSPIFYEIYTIVKYHYFLPKALKIEQCEST